METETHRSSNNLLKSHQRHCGAELRRRHSNRNRPHSNTDILLTARCCLVPFRHTGRLFSTQKETSIIGWWFGCLFGFLVFWLFGWLVVCLFVCLFVCLVFWLVVCLVGCMFVWLVGFLVGWFVGC